MYVLLKGQKRNNLNTSIGINVTFWAVFTTETICKTLKVFCASGVIFIIEQILINTGSDLLVLLLNPDGCNLKIYG